MKKRANKLKHAIDAVMSIVLLFLMAFQVTGDKYHEWIGAGMLVLFLIHNFLNAGWYKALFKGKYSALRILRTIVNLLVLAAILITGYSGIVMSRYVFDFLPISGGMATARKLHLAGSYWAFVLMSIHLGMHWSMMTGKYLKGKKNNTILIILVRILATVIASTGAYFFARTEIFYNMFLKNEFAILDYETPGVLIIFQNLAMMSTWVFIGHYFTQGLGKLTFSVKKGKAGLKQGILYLCTAIAMILLCVILTPGKESENNSWGVGRDSSEVIETEKITESARMEENTSEKESVQVSDSYIYITGGTFEMGSPDSEDWRSPDETLHTVTVNDFYISAYEVTQKEYKEIMGTNPSMFEGAELPVENISWQEAVLYCNARSKEEGLSDAYTIYGDIGSEEFSVIWNQGANGYRLPTEAEWEYACRAGTTTPFNTETSISPEEANYYGHYPYEIESNYFEQDNLSTKPGEYRETTVPVDSFSPNTWGLYNMHGNVSEWVWDYYGAYDTEEVTDPVGPTSGNLKVYRGGGWNDFAKNMRSAYRATMEEDMGSFNIGIRLVRNATDRPENKIESHHITENNTLENDAGNVLIAYFSWSGNTKGIAEEIQAQTGADMFEITLVEPYSSDYNTVLDQSQRDQNIQARPELEGHIENMENYDTILLGYPNWWASIPMPIASFLEEYDFTGKTIVPFCSHGGGRFGQSLTAIAKLAPDSTMGEGLSVHYSGGSTVASDIAEWLRTNGIVK